MNDWIDARTRLPCASGWYIVIVKWYQPYREQFLIVHYNAVHGFWWFDEDETVYEDGYYINDSVLYWMPLPPRPGEEVT